MNQPDKTAKTAKGFFSALFDLSFKSYVFPQVIKILFVIVIILSALGAVGLIAAAFASNVIVGIFTVIIVGPLYFLLTVIFYRVIFEVISAVFTITDNTNKLVQASRMSASAGGAFPGTDNPPPGPYPGASPGL